MAPDYPIRTERLSLRPFDLDDRAALYSWQAREDVARYLYSAPRSVEESAASLAAKIAVGWPVPEGEMLSLAVERDGVVVGEAVLKHLSEQHRQGEVGYILHPDHHGFGYATEAARAVLRLGFEDLGLHRIAAVCHAGNDASWRVMEKLGMRREAHFRHAVMFKGEWVETVVYALLEDEWRAQR
ncbi:GNAT family protein [Actinosynnema sp. NPDC020468]|uniref:GNAT family N-acetyltransferase n=1 Tax=Actinosynnema sp. NPDC020468 TaxID=3154488 RepID=UPI0033E89542